MTLRLPQQRTYYYELGKREKRLVLCLTKKEIQGFVKRKGVKRSLEWHHRDGLDVSVSNAEFDYLKEVYGLDLGLDAEALWMAFRAWREQLAKRGSRPGTRGFIRARVLEKMAGLAERRHGEELRAPLPEVPPEELRVAQMVRQARIRELALALPVEEVLDKSELEDLPAQVPAMKGRDRPFDVFSRMQRQQRARRKGGQ
jgi:hypothetical protein